MDGWNEKKLFHFSHFSVHRPGRPLVRAAAVLGIATPAALVAFPSHKPFPALAPRRLVLAREVGQGGGRAAGGGVDRGLRVIGLAALPAEVAVRERERKKKK